MDYMELYPRTTAARTSDPITPKSGYWNELKYSIDKISNFNR
jgi:hypothetical protein